MHRPLPIYVVHYEAAEWCQDTVTSLSNSTIPTRITVVDNGGLESIRGASLLSTGSNLGFTGAANLAIECWLETGEDLVVITSHDLRVEPDCLEEMVSCARDNATTGILGPDLGLNLPGDDLATYGDAISASPHSGSQLERRPMLTACERRSWVSGSCLMIRRECIELIGGFDERFGSYSEDVDIGIRANKRGWDVVCVAGARGSTKGSAHASATEAIWTNWILSDAKHLGLRQAFHRSRYNIGNARLALKTMLRHPATRSDQWKILRMHTRCLRRGWFRVCSLMAATQAEAALARIGRSRRRSKPR